MIFSQICEVAWLHMSILYLITVIADQLINIYCIVLATFLGFGSTCT